MSLASTVKYLVMKIRFLTSSCIAVLLLQFALALPVAAQVETNAVVAPIITSQPINKTNEYGADASFSVVAGGNGLRYRWLKNSRDLHDYGNIAGSKTPNLTLVGVAGNDAGQYSVVVSNSGGSVTSAVVTLSVNSSIIFNDNFESGLANWSVFYDPRRAPDSTETAATPLTPSTRKNHTTGGTRSAILNSSTDKMFHNLGRKLFGRVRATFWIYDDGGTQTRYFGELRGHSGPGHTTYAGPGGPKQSFAIGVYNNAFPTNSTGVLTSEKTLPSKYQGRVDRGQNIGWFNLDAPGTPDRTVGWHKFEIERMPDGTNVNFYVDGVLGKSITGANYVALDSVAIGSIGRGLGVNGNAWFDDIKVEAWHKTFDWQNLDSAGAGLFDWMRLRETGTNALVTEINSVAELTSGSTNWSLGRWTAESSGLSTLDTRGGLGYYAVNVPAADSYRIEIEGRGRNARNLHIEEIPLIVSIDDQYLGRFLLPFSSSSNQFVHCFTPFIKAGPHTISIVWDNANIHNSLLLRAVRLQRLKGPDSNANGIKDWVENRLYAQSGTDVFPEKSFVSPVCVEGKGAFLNTMSLLAKAGNYSATIPVQAGTGDRWYANVPLSSDSLTHIDLSYQNGGLEESGDIEWQVTDLLSANDITLRKGDSLLFSAIPEGATNGEVAIVIENVANYTTDVLHPVAHQFDQVGTYAVTGNYVSSSNTFSRTIHVKVIEANLGPSIAAWVGHRRFWDCTNLPPEVVLDIDPRLQMAFDTTSGRYSLTNDSIQPRVLLARLGTNGPVVASTDVNGFNFYNDADSWLRLVETYSDGSQLVEAGFILSPVLNDITVECQVIVSGVSFDDGTLAKILTPADFDSLGICRVRFIRAPGVKTSVCHATRIYQGTELIGWPVYVK